MPSPLRTPGLNIRTLKLIRLLTLKKKKIQTNQPEGFQSHENVKISTAVLNLGYC